MANNNDVNYLFSEGDIKNTADHADVQAKQSANYRNGNQRNSKAHVADPVPPAHGGAKPRKKTRVLGMIAVALVIFILGGVVGFVGKGHYDKYKLTWEVHDGILMFYGNGNIPNFDENDETPWAAVTAAPWDTAATENDMGISTIVMHGEIKRIGNRAFENCFYIETVYFSDDLKKIGDYAFRHCQSIQELNFPESLEVIGEEAFEGCLELKTVTLSGHVREIAEDAFNKCFKLTDIYFGGTKTDWEALGCTVPEGATVHYSEILY